MTPSPSRNPVISLLLAVLLLGGAAATHADGLLVRDGEKIAFLGDSITQFGWEQPGGYVKLVISGLHEAGVNAVPIPAGISGQTSREMLARIDGVLSARPDWLTVSCGVNDVWHGATGVDLETYKKNITEIVDRALAKGVKVVILTATPIYQTDNPNNDKLAAYNDFLRQIAVERKLPFADLNAAIWNAVKAQPDRPVTADGVHMNAYGNMVMAAGVLQALGALPETVAKARQRWEDAPDAAFVASHLTLSGLAPVSLPQYETLCQIAAARKMPLDRLLFPLYVQAVRDAFAAHADVTGIEPGDLQKEVAAEFGKQVAAFLARQSASAGG